MSYMHNLKNANINEWQKLALYVYETCPGKRGFNSTPLNTVPSRLVVFGFYRHFNS